MSETVRDYRPEDAPAISDLWDRCFGEARGGQTVDWLFRPGPAGDAPRSVVEIDGRVVAHAGAAPLRFRLGGQQVRGGYSVGAMTDPDFQGRGLFVRVGRHLYKRMERDGFAFVAGFSNKNSHRLMTGPLGRRSVEPFPWCVKPLRPVDLALGLLGAGGASRAEPARPESAEIDGIRVAPCAPSDARLDPLWKRTAESLRVGAVRDVAFARWRFDSRPDAGYAGWLAERNGEPAAWAATRELPLRGVRALFVVDLLVAPSEERAGRALLRTLSRSARRSGVAVLSALLPGAGAARTALRGSGFWSVPQRLHPQAIRFSVRGFGRWADHADLADPAAWWLGWSDTDVV